MIFVSQRLAPNQGLFAGLFIAIIFLVTNGQAEPPRSICSEIRTEGTCVASSQDGFKCAWTGETHILQPDALTPDRGLCIQDIQARADDGGAHDANELAALPKMSAEPCGVSVDAKLT